MYKIYLLVKKIKLYRLDFKFETFGKNRCVVVKLILFYIYIFFCDYNFRYMQFLQRQTSLQIFKIP